MKKNSKNAGASKKRSAGQGYTLGIDLGDKTSKYCVVGGEGVVARGKVATSRAGMAELGQWRGSMAVIEVGTHSGWVEQALREFGLEVVVANPRRVRLISQGSNKRDEVDAELLARLGRADRTLLSPVRQRGEQARMDLLRVRVRAQLVEARTGLINTVRGMVKSAGERIGECDTAAFDARRVEELPAELARVIKPLVRQIEGLNQELRELEHELEQIAKERYPETARLRQVAGVGLLIALTFVLTIEDPGRFRKSREVGCYTGLKPKRSQSGERDPQLGITKEGDVYLRKLLVQGAHRVLSAAAPDTDLKRWGQKLAGSEKNGRAKKRAVVAVARKLGILLHRLWVSGEAYEPLRNARHMARAA